MHNRTFPRILCIQRTELSSQEKYDFTVAFEIVRCFLENHRTKTREYLSLRAMFTFLLTGREEMNDSPFVMPYLTQLRSNQFKVSGTNNIMFDPKYLLHLIIYARLLLRGEQQELITLEKSVTFIMKELPKRIELETSEIFAEFFHYKPHVRRISWDSCRGNHRDHYLSGVVDYYLTSTLRILLEWRKFLDLSKFGLHESSHPLSEFLKAREVFFEE